MRQIEQRYSDAPPATLIVPTIEAFAGWKTMAWHERGAPRDLYDLWALAEAGALTANAAELFIRYGPTGTAPRAFMFAAPPSEQAWHAALATQTRLQVTAAEALDVVRRSWATAIGEMLQ
ncbi:MAG: nucleotidyl transferase AbiEii/AbiGii toxin family protein [Sciscionella sp.]|nr:nucleotidyl transferase AbiEii/AbiGii toxin family protein [Sciscionella sp.]